MKEVEFMEENESMENQKEETESVQETSPEPKKQPKKPIGLYIAAGITGACSIAFGVAYPITNIYKNVINMALQLTGTKQIEATNTAAIDTKYFKSDYKNQDELFEADKKIAEELTEEGSVLLKNANNALPLQKTEKITLLGHSSCNMLVCGTGSADIKADGAPNLYQTLTKRGFDVNKPVWDYYSDLVRTNQYQTNPKKGDNSIRGGDGGVKGSYTVNEVPWSTLTASSDVNNSLSSYNDAAVIVVSRLGGEMYDLPSDVAHQGNADETVGESGNSLELTKNELDLIDHAKASFKKVIVLVNSANPIECDFLTKGDSKVDAALWIGYTGLQGLEGVADLLAGNVSPSGRLVDTYCNDNTTAPAMQNFYSETWTNANDYPKDMKDIGLDSTMYYNAYKEGIYVGYRYYETRYEDYVYQKSGVGEYQYLNDVAYPFGYGLSYTTFEHSKPEFKENKDDDTIDVTLTVTNTGSHKGKDVVEVYFQSEYTDYDKENGIEKAAVELCGFAKTKELEPGAKEKVTIKVNRSEFATYDAKGKKTYILDAGKYFLSVGNNAHDALNNIIVKKGGSANKGLMKAIGTDAAQGNGDNVYQFDVAAIDDETYSKGADGKKITNQMDSASLSFYGLADMNYLSRSNWVSTWPSHEMIELNQKLHDEMTGIKEYTPVTIEGETMPKMNQSNGLSLIMLRGKKYDDPKWELLLDQLSYEDMASMVGMGYHGMGAVTSVGKPLTKDENGPQGFSGSLTDITGDAKTMCAYTDENIMAATWNTPFMEEIGKHLGEDGLALGYNGLYGPAMNTHRTAYSGRNFEYYSEDGFLAGKIAASEVKGIQSKGVYVFIKHFALNDEETHCRSISTFANEQSIREIYLKPFELAIKEGGAHNVMTAFSRVGVIWSSAHEGLMTNVLRNEWGMDGYAVSDYTTSGVTTGTHNRSTYDPYLAVPAGTDTFDSSAETSQKSFLKRLEKQKDVHMTNMMRQACHRILYVTANSNAMNGITDGTVILNVLTWWQMAIIDGSIYCGIACVVLLVIAIVKQVKYNKFKKLSDGADNVEE